MWDFEFPKPKIRIVELRQIRIFPIDSLIWSGDGHNTRAANKLRQRRCDSLVEFRGSYFTFYQGGYRLRNPMNDFFSIVQFLSRHARFNMI